MAEKPQIKPNAFFGAIIFALVVTLLYMYYPQIEILLPINGQTMEIPSSIKPASIEQECKAANSIVIAKVGKKSTNHLIGTASMNADFIVYSEVTIEVMQVLKGSPTLNDDKTMLTYELGGSVLLNDVGHQAKYTFVYTDSAKLDKDAIVMLFLDTENNIINEKYGILLQKVEEHYLDYASNTFTFEQIQAYLNEG